MLVPLAQRLQQPQALPPARPLGPMPQAPQAHPPPAWGLALVRLASRLPAWQPLALRRVRLMQLAPMHLRGRLREPYAPLVLQVLMMDP